MLMHSVYNQKVKVMFQNLQLLPWKQRLKNQGFKKYLVFSADLLTLKAYIRYLNLLTVKANIKYSKAIKVNMVLFM